MSQDVAQIDRLRTNQTPHADMTVQSPNPFHLSWHDHSRGLYGQIARRFDRLVEHLFGLSKLARIYDDIRRESAGVPQEQFAALVLKRLGVDWEIDPGELEKIPKSGPTIVVANHPFGGPEGLILFDLLFQVRPDARVLANFLVERVPELRPMVIAADPFVREQARARNLFASRAAIDWLSKGGLLAMFPSGVVSHLHFNPMQVMDPAWSETATRFAMGSQAKVIPIFFPGQNGWLFQSAGIINPRLRTALLPRELCAKHGLSIKVRIGSAISGERLCQFETRSQATNYLRARTYLLNSRSATNTVEPDDSLKHDTTIAPGFDKTSLDDEIRALPQHFHLLSKGTFDFYCTPADQIPKILTEIGRQREIAFRAEGEGTGKELDLDSFDQTYMHLFAWNRERREIAGAYRLAAAKSLIEQSGTEALYSRSLFDFGSELINRLGNALEMGRSFVNTEYQRSPEVLLGLWQAIGEYIWRNPEVRALFGLVSISRQYCNVSREIMVDFLHRKHYRSDLSALIQPVNPFRSHQLFGLTKRQAESLEKVEDIDAVLHDIEGKKIPVLLKHYLKLGADVLHFGVDPNFSDTVVVLIVVDLLRTEPKRVERFMGKGRAEGYLTSHGVSFLDPMLAPGDSTISLVEQPDRQSIR